jgi:hypothetical protein
MVMRYHYGLGVGHTYASRPQRPASGDPRHHTQRTVVPDMTSEDDGDDGSFWEQDKNLGDDEDDEESNDFQNIDNSDHRAENESDEDDDEFLAMDEMYGDYGNEYDYGL